MLLTAGLSTGYIFEPSDKSDGSNQTRQEMVLTTFENSDYDGWKKLMGKKGRLAEVVDQACFAKFVEARYAVRAGEYDRAIALSDDLVEDIKLKFAETVLTA